MNTAKLIINGKEYEVQLTDEAVEEFGEEIKWLAENRPKWF